MTTRLKMDPVAYLDASQSVTASSEVYARAKLRSLFAKDTMIRTLACLILSCLMIAPGAADSVTWRSAEQRVSIAYDNTHWQPTQVDLKIPNLQFAIVLINHETGKKFGFCDLRAGAMPYAKQMTSGSLGGHIAHAAHLLHQEYQLEDPSTELVESKFAIIGGRPVIRHVLLGSKIKSIVVQAFRGDDEIRIECAYSAAQAAEVGPRVITEGAFEEVLQSLRIED